MDIERRQKQLDDIKEQGYFLMADGKKSNEIELEDRKCKSRHCQTVEAKLAKTEKALAAAHQSATEIKSKV